ncbi:lamin tail domain-containing protein [Nannocystis bainbridge]|uniref:Lamin tail domain-containing protein n=1 Tax=Nannocystis bainbridge TaxID=2995303 RepID=A0ABT5E1A4_9BACT|nr:lamin tail domain-containing protein [Nannocystis bainbridge]MDC0719632.1 lamin tail domain-containing protein [Nannocystis bainbridge]
MHSRHLVTPLFFFAFTAACGAWSPQPAGVPADTSTSTTGSTGLGTSTAADTTTWPSLTDWGAAPVDLGLPEATSTLGTGSGGPVLTDTFGEPSIALGVLRITEVMADPDGKDGGATSPEFVEIAHVGEQPLTLGGLVVAARSWPELWMGDLGIGGEVLQPGERLLLLRYASPADLPVPAILREGEVLRAAFADSGGLRNDDGAVGLRDQDGNLGDTLLYGATQPAPFDDPALWSGPPAAVPGAGESLCRVDPAVDSDSAADWIACAPSPGELPVLGGDDDSTGEPSLPATLAIVEVLSNPSGPASLEKHAEFVEVVNLGPGAVDLAGFTLADSVDPGAPGVDPLLYFSGDGGCAPNTCLAPGRKALLVGSLYEGPVGAALVLRTDDNALANAGLGNVEPVVLRDDLGELRSSYRAWPDPLAAPDPATQEAALVRAAPEAPDAPDSWDFAAPSPGL